MSLIIDSVSASYRQGQHVISDLSLSVSSGEMVLLIGHNGAGKTTFLNCVYGIHAPTAGHVSVEGTTLKRGTDSRLRAGVALVPSEHACFTQLSVMENLTVAATVTKPSRAEYAEVLESTLEIFPALRDKREAAASSLSGGQRRMLAIGMALTQRPRYLLLDEPSLGLAPQVVEDVYGKLGELRRKLGLGVVVVEQNLQPTLLKADRVHVVRTGREVFVGDSAELEQQDLWELL